MTAEEIAEAIEDLLRAITEDEESDDTELRGAALCPFRRAGLLITDAGVVITLKDGSEFRISVGPISCRTYR